MITANGFDDINLYDKFMKQFLADYIFSAITSNDPITAKPMVIEKLNGIVTELENPKEIPVKQMPSIAKVISGKNYVFDTNDLGFQSTSLSFSDDECVWEYAIGEQKVYLQVGLNGKYLINEIGFSMGVNPNGEAIACKGYWNNNTFIVDHHIVGDPSKQAFKFIFVEDTLSMNLTTVGLDVAIKGTKAK